MHGGRLRESRHKRHSSAPSAPLPLTRSRHYNNARAVVMPRGRLTDALSHVAVDCDRSNQDPSTRNMGRAQSQSIGTAGRDHPVRSAQGHHHLDQTTGEVS
jgi:hypothetical protein